MTAVNHSRGPWDLRDPGLACQKVREVADQVFHLPRRQGSAQRSTRQAGVLRRQDDRGRLDAPNRQIDIGVLRHRLLFPGSVVRQYARPLDQKIGHCQGGNIQRADFGSPSVFAIHPKKRYDRHHITLAGPELHCVILAAVRRGKYGHMISIGPADNVASEIEVFPASGMK